MSLEENKTIVRRFIDSYNNRNLDLLDDIVAPDYFDHTHQLKDLESIKQIFNMAFIAFPDWHETIEDMIAEGDMVWVRLSYTGTNTGEWFGQAPTGNKITAKAVAIYHIVNGKLTEGRFITDQLDMLKQIGVIEYTEKGKKMLPEDST